MNENPEHEKWLQQHDEMMADFDREMAKMRQFQEGTERTLRRAIRLSVRDARRQRDVNAAQAIVNAAQGERNREHDESVARLEKALAAFLERGGNGKH